MKAKPMSKTEIMTVAQFYNGGYNELLIEGKINAEIVIDYRGIFSDDLIEQLGKVTPQDMPIMRTPISAPIIPGYGGYYIDTTETVDSPIGKLKVPYEVLTGFESVIVNWVGFDE